MAALMLVSGAMCFAGALHSRRWLSIIAAAAMLAAMIDLSLLGVVPAVAWSLMLMLLGFALAVKLRLAPTAPKLAGVPHGALASAPPRVGSQWRIPRLGRATAVLAALAFEVMALQVLQHGALAEALPPVGNGTAASHTGHTGSGSVLRITVLAAAGVLITAFGVCGVASIVRRRFAPALECTGMAVMLFAMLFH